jgi:SnoaL-like polyketide cyclase
MKSALRNKDICAAIQEQPVIDKPFRLVWLAGFILVLFDPALAAESVQINDLVIAHGIPAARRGATVKAVRTFYEFWNTGDVVLLKQAIAENFTDRTLPPGRPQGPEGPAFASRQFRAAGPRQSRKRPHHGQLAH